VTTPGWLGGLERRMHAWVVDVVFSLALAAVLGPLTVGAVRSADMSSAELVSAGIAFGVLHAVVAIRRTATAVAYVAASLAMLTVVLIPDARTADAAVPILFMPSSLVFLVPLYTVAARPPRRFGALVLPIALVGAVLATIRSAGALRQVYPGAWWVPVYLGAGLIITVLATWGLGYLRLIRRQRDAAARAEATRRAVLEERSRIARDMHDVVAHSLAVIVRQAEGGAFAAARAPEQAAQALRVIADTGRDALNDMRGLLGVLRGPAEVSASLADLPELLDRVREAGLDVECVRQGTPYELGAATELAAYRVVQEALTNVIKHVGRGAGTRVLLEWTAADLVVEITDSGPAGHDPVPGAGAGLQGLRERVAVVGGTFEAGPLDTGFRVRAVFPRRGTS
jgi:signal transduction histidine kinase